MDEAELKRRTKEFALQCMKLAESLPHTRSGNTIANQLIRCGTSVGANYRAACRGRSRAEFLSKLGVVEEEADESSFWMELIVDSGMRPPTEIRPLHDEAQQLVRITVASIRTARSSSSSIRNPKPKIQNP
jgi:four helix bundle protein